MVKTKTPTIESPGDSVATEKIPPTIKEIDSWLIRDLASARVLIDAILTDAELRNHLATFMQGRYSNHLNKPTSNPTEQ